MKKINVKSIFFYFFLFTLIIITFSIFSFAQVKTLVTLNLSENESVYKIFTDSLQTNYAVVISSQSEGLVTSITEYYIITKENKIGPFEKVLDAVFFDNGKQLLISVKKDGSYYVYKNNEITGPYSDIGRFSAIFSADIFSYWIKENNQLYVIYSGTKMGPFLEVSSMLADQKTQKIVFIGKKDKSELFINGVSIEKSDKIVLFGFYSDKRILCYASGSSGSYYMTVGSKKFGPFENIGLDIAVKDENLAIFFVKISGKWYLLAGKEKVGPFDSTGFVAISPDGKKLAYAAYTEANGWNIYMGTKLYKSVDKPYLSFLDFIKTDSSNYDIIYLAGDYSEENYIWSIFIGNNEDPFFEYNLDSDDPYVGTLNISYYGVDFIHDFEGFIGFIGYEESGYYVGIYSIQNSTFGIFGYGEDYDITFILDIANNVIYFVLNGEFFIGVPSESAFFSLTGFKTCGNLVYGLDGSKIGVVYFDSKTNNVCFVSLDNVVDAISAIYQ